MSTTLTNYRTVTLCDFPVMSGNISELNLFLPDIIRQCPVKHARTAMRAQVAAREATCV